MQQNILYVLLYRPAFLQSITNLKQTHYHLCNYFSIAQHILSLYLYHLILVGDGILPCAALDFLGGIHAFGELGRSSNRFFSYA